MEIFVRPKSDPDILARNIAEWGRLAASMPPAWEGAAISHPIGGDGGYLGRMLPGKGLLLSSDLKNVGITKGLPHVYERSPFMRLTDSWHRRKWSDRARDALAKHHLGFTSDWTTRLLSERGAITTYDSIIAARAAQTGAPLDIVASKPSVTTVASQWHSLNLLVGNPVAMTLTTTPGAIMTNTNVGSWGRPWGATSSSTSRYLLSFGYAAAQIINMALLHDVLLAVSGIAVNTSGTYSFSSPPALTRYTSGAGVQAVLEVQVATFSGTAATLLLNYTGVGTGTNATAAQPVRSTAAIVSMLQPSITGSAANNWPWFTLGSGDYGMTAPVSVVAGGTQMGGTSTCVLYLYFPLMFVPGVAAQMYVERDSTIQIDGLIALAQDTSYVPGCLGLFVMANTTSSGIMQAFLRSCVG